MAVNNNNNEKQHSLTHIWNEGFDRSNQLPWIQTLEYVPENGSAEQGFERRTSLNLQLRLDDTSETSITYIGYSRPGTGTDENKWRIKRLDESDGIVILWADGDSEFDNIWDNRTSLNYS